MVKNMEGHYSAYGPQCSKLSRHPLPDLKTLSKRLEYPVFILRVGPKNSSFCWYLSMFLQGMKATFLA